MSNINRIWIVTPTVREDSFARFTSEWNELFNHHNVILVKVQDGETPELHIHDYSDNSTEKYVFEKDTDNELDNLFYNYTDGIRNLGFYYVAQNGSLDDVIITMDDDVYPYDNDPIQSHLEVLGRYVPTSWMSSTVFGEEYMRGMPYEVRNESEVLVSHGVWENVPDLDAPTQLVKGIKPEGYEFARTVVPKGIYFPFCIMNVAFKMQAMPYMYQAPSGRTCPHGIDRFADIWCGINLVRYAQEHNFAIVTGYATIWHDRASNVFENLKKENKGICLNEHYWKGVESDPYYELYNNQRKLWEKTINQLLHIRL
jgi:reversibly glycosylated polypeptide / UDP-arabinopyranose mutase